MKRFALGLSHPRVSAFIRVLFVVLVAASGCRLQPRNWSDFVRQLERMAPPAREAAIERYLAAHDGTPLIENQTRLVFVAQDQRGVSPRVVGDFNRWAVRPAEPSGPAAYDASIGTMTRIEGTTWSYLEGTAWTNARVEYVLLFDTEARPDPLNPRLVQAFAGPRSEARMPLWVAQPELDDQTPAPAGDLIAESFTSRSLGGPRRVWYYLPAGYQTAADTLYPVAYVLDGGNFIERMDARRVLDRLIARKAIPPLIAVFSEPGEPQEEYSRDAKWRAFITSELVPAVDTRFRTFSAPDHRLILGTSLAAYGAVDLAIEFPSVFGLCAAMAPPPQTVTVITNQAKGRMGAVSIRFFVLGAIYDSLIDAARRLRTALEEANAPVIYLEVSEGHSTETFRGHLDDAVKTLLAGQ